MKKITYSLILILSSFYVEAQSYMGFLTDNYSGVNSVIANPANIVDSRFKTDINLTGFSVFAGNDYYGINILDATKDGYDFDLDAKKSPTANNNVAMNVDVMGPSFMFNINEKNSIAIYTRARSFANINEINGASIDAIDDDTSDDFNINEGDFNVFAQAWAEAGITYARILFNEDHHFLKGGLTLKYLQGGGSGYVYGKNVTVNYDADGAGPDAASISSNGQLIYGRFDNFDNEDYDYELPEATGFGADLGFVYEWRPNHIDYTRTNADGEAFTLKDKNKYKLKLGLSITDLGSINYKNALEETFDITNNVTEEDIENEDDLNDILNNLYTLTNSKIGYKTKLPTALHLNADWSFNAKFYLNLNTDFSLVSKNKINASRISNTVSLTPRYESKWFSFYLPISIIENNGFQIGTGLRAGPLYIGSGSILSALTSDKSKGTDIFAGIKIPIYQGKAKDIDNDVL